METNSSCCFGNEKVNTAYMDKGAFFSGCREMGMLMCSLEACVWKMKSVYSLKG